MDNLRIWFLVWLCLCRFVTAVVYVRGKGASFPHEVYKEWRSAYRLHRSSHVELDMPYEAVGSGNGKKAIMENVDIEYAGSDSVLSESTIASHTDLVLFPIMAGAVMLGYNIPELGGRLVLTRSTIVGIFNGTYTWWNDTVFTSNNPYLNMPNKRIIVIARADKSGTTSTFTEALTAFSPEWKQQYGVFSKGYDSANGVPYSWGSNVITYYGQQNRGVSGLILSFRNSIGYLSVADAYEANIESAAIINKAGRAINANASTVQSAMDYLSERNTELTFSLADAGSESAYPIAGFTHIIMYKTQMEDCASSKELIRYIFWAMTEEDQRAACDSKGMAPLSKALVQQILTVVLKNVLCHGANVWDMVQSDIASENKVEQHWIIPVAITIPIVVLCIFVLSSYIIKQRMRIQKMIDNDEWLIPLEDILFYFDGRDRSSMASRIADLPSLISNASVRDIQDDDILIKQIIQWPGKYKGSKIGIRLIEVEELNQLTRQTKHQLLLLKNKITHGNVVRIFGLTEVDENRYVIGDYCGKGRMTNLLRDDKFNLSIDFKCTLAGDVANGMHYLHSNDIIHGLLRSDVCLIDDRWQVKICDWEYGTLLSSQQVNTSPILAIRKKSENDLTTNDISFKNFWVSPDILRSDFKLFPTKDSDIYSFAIILQEIFTREDPYAEHAGILTPTEVIHAVTLNNLRPEHHEDTPVHIRQLMEICWNDNAISRPSFEQVLKLLKRANPLKKTVVDSMISSMEEYIAHLEERVEEKNAELKISNNKLETTLSSLMPVCIAKTISKGKSVKPMFFPAIAVAVLDISHSVNIVTVNPHDLIAFINDLCFEIDMIARKYSAYTAPLSGCSLALVDGLESSCTQMEEMCLSMVNLCADILVHEEIDKLTESTEHQFDLRLGIHVGPAITGLSGITSPTFVVFGDCTDVAQALARTAPIRSLHVSENMWRAVKRSKQLETSTAGELNVKGKTFVTYTVKRLQEKVKYATSEDSGVGGEQQGQTDCSDLRKPNNTNEHMYKTSGMSVPVMNEETRSNMVVQNPVSNKTNHKHEDGDNQHNDDTVFSHITASSNHPDVFNDKLRTRANYHHHKRHSSFRKHRSRQFSNGSDTQDSIAPLPSDVISVNTTYVGLPVSKEYVPVKSKWKRIFTLNNIYPENS
ncbi:retinal guanylyl cyclase 1-like [Pecten maximus]|uniref:retinal guanylyl cyclase 1-like n=1 Tax=Pecten maximus TaxID=6579 RepID=UPI001458BDE5|nr:retinal guanylyl cyclase 1-like [Pecten maximus]